MVKASTPVVVLLVSWLWGIANPSMGDIGNILVIVAGVTMASLGEIQFSWIGLAFQMVGIVFEAVRVVLLQVLVSGEGLNMDPLVGLYYYAPICAAINFLVACVIEIPKFTVDGMSQSAFLMLFISAPVAFMLNLTSMALVSRICGSCTDIEKEGILVLTNITDWTNLCCCHVSRRYFQEYSTCSLLCCHLAYNHFTPATDRLRNRTCRSHVLFLWV